MPEEAHSFFASVEAKKEEWRVFWTEKTVSKRVSFWGT